MVIELKSSDKPEHIERDASNALKQIVDQNYRNQEGLPNIRNFREYGIASYHLASFVEGRYLENDAQSRWVEKDDPTMRNLGGLRGFDYIPYNCYPFCTYIRLNGETRLPHFPCDTYQMIPR